MKLISIRVDRTAGPVTAARLVHFRKTLQCARSLSTSHLYRALFTIPSILFSSLRRSVSLLSRSSYNNPRRSWPGGVTDRRQIHPSLLSSGLFRSILHYFFYIYTYKTRRKRAQKKTLIGTFPNTIIIERYTHCTTLNRPVECLNIRKYIRYF